MTTHVQFIEDSQGDLVDEKWYCSFFCYDADGNDGIGAWPCGTETDYDVYCARCESLLWHGLECDCPDKPY